MVERVAELFICKISLNHLFETWSFLVDCLAKNQFEFFLPDLKEIISLKVGVFYG